MTIFLLCVTVCVGALAFLEFKKPGTVQGWIDAVRKKKE